MDQVEINKMWNTCEVVVQFAPNTGSKRPWEMYGIFTYPVSRKVFWGSYKTEEAAKKSQNKKQKKNRQKIQIIKIAVDI